MNSWDCNLLINEVHILIKGNLVYKFRNVNNIYLYYFYVESFNILFEIDILKYNWKTDTDSQIDAVRHLPG